MGTAGNNTLNHSGVTFGDHRCARFGIGDDEAEGSAWEYRVALELPTVSTRIQVSVVQPATNNLPRAAGRLDPLHPGVAVPEPPADSSVSITWSAADTGITRCSENQPMASRATASIAPGSSKRWVAPGMMFRR